MQRKKSFDLFVKEKHHSLSGAWPEGQVIGKNPEQVPRDDVWRTVFAGGTPGPWTRWSSPSLVHLSDLHGDGFLIERVCCRQSLQRCMSTTGTCSVTSWTRGCCGWPGLHGTISLLLMRATSQEWSRDHSGPQHRGSVCCVCVGRRVVIASCCVEGVVGLFCRNQPKFLELCAPALRRLWLEQLPYSLTFCINCPTSLSSWET